MQSNLNTTDGYDVVTLGETMIRLSPSDFQRLETAEQLQLHVGGSESNTAVGLARMGKKVAWLSRLTTNPLGRRITSTLAAHGVDTQHVCWTPEDRVGTYYFEQGSAPRSSQVIYDRRGSAFSNYTASMLPRELFTRGRSKILHVTGISLALNERVQATVAQAIEWAKAARWLVSFDVNHRSLLWSYEQARSVVRPLLETADLVFLPIRDAIGLYPQLDGDSDEAILKWLMQLRSGKTTIMTLGDRGCIAGTSSEILSHSIVPVAPIGRLGGGDAFSAGFLTGWLETADLATSMRWAVAMARLKYSIPGDLPIMTRAEVESLVCSDEDASLKR